MTLPIGSRFGPNDLGLVRLYLRNMVEKKQSSFITTMDVYKDEPWLLPHVSNPLFYKKQWYYFVPRSKGRGQTPNRNVPGRGGSLGGFWKYSGKQEKILDGENRLMGFKQCLSYYRKCEHLKDGLNTNWLMTEYTLDKGLEFQELVLCQIREKKATQDQRLGFFIHVPQPQPQPQPRPQVAETRETNNVVSNQLVEEDADFADMLEALMLQVEDGDDTQQQQQPQEEEEIQILPPLQSNDNNGVMMTTQQQQPQEEEEIQILPPLQSNDNNGVMMTTQQQQAEQEEEEIPILLQVQSNDNNGVMMTTRQELYELEAKMLQGEDRDDTQQQQPQQEVEEIQLLPPLQSNDNNGVMMTTQQQQAQQEEEEIPILLPVQSNDNNGVMMTIQQQQAHQEEEEEIPILLPVQSNDNNGVMITTRQEIYELEAMMLQGEDRDDTQQQQPHQEEEEIQILFPVQSNDNNGVLMAYPELREFEAMLLQRGDGDDIQQQQQQEEEEEILILPPLLINDYNIDVMMMSNQEELDEWDSDSWEAELDKDFDMSDVRRELLGEDQE